MAFTLFQLIFFSNVLQFSAHKSYTYIVRLIHNYFIFFEAIANVFLKFPFLFVHFQHIKIYIIDLLHSDLMSYDHANLIYQLVDFMVKRNYGKFSFLMQMIILNVNKDVLYSFCFPYRPAGKPQYNAERKRCKWAFFEPLHQIY